MSIQATANVPYPNRLQLGVTGLSLPFSSTVRAFDPSEDLEIYIDGSLAEVISFSVDMTGRYLLFMSRPFDANSVVQVIYHIPTAPFKDSSGNFLPGFAIRAASNPTAEGQGPVNYSNIIIQDSVSGSYYSLYVDQASLNLAPLSSPPSSPPPVVYLIDNSNNQCYQLVVLEGAYEVVPVAMNSSAVNQYALIDATTSVVLNLFVQSGSLQLD